MLFTDQDLPFSADHLNPVISTRQVEFHFSKHQLGYASKLADLVKDRPFADMELEDIIRETAFDDDKVAIYNNAAQLWNHIFYWAGLKAPTDDNKMPKGDLLNAVNTVFKTEDELKQALIDTGTSVFGSGWVWLVLDPKTKLLGITKTQNADNPVIHNMIPLLTIDVWEHAYYLDYQNRRADYLKEIVHKAIDWNAVQERYLVNMSK